MNIVQIKQLISSLDRDNDQKIELIETHISWVILCDTLVYKIKKPLTLSFLDFSSLAKRKHYCDRELLLNQRLTSDMYLKVIPIRLDGDSLVISEGQEQIVDYCLVMRRIDNKREMRALLQKDRVTMSHIDMIAQQLVAFHQKSTVITKGVSAKMLWADFKDIDQISSFVKDHLGQKKEDYVKQMLDIVKIYLDQNLELIKQRDLNGFTRDCHGDLHSGNIFLLTEPVIFDCIEFNDHFRQIDILNELAFLCIDLEVYNRKDLSDYFISQYNLLTPLFDNDSESHLLTFYKLYRCNIKVKVNAIKCQQTDNPAFFKERFEIFKRYFNLMLTYTKSLK